MHATVSAYTCMQLMNDLLEEVNVLIVEAVVGLYYYKNKRNFKVFSYYIITSLSLSFYSSEVALCL